MEAYHVAVEGPDLVEGVDGGRETAVEAEDLVLDERGEGEEIEQIGEVFPHVGAAVFPEALVVEAIAAGVVSTASERNTSRRTLG